MSLSLQYDSLSPANSLPSVADKSDNSSLSKMVRSCGPVELQQELDLDKTLTPSKSTVQERGIVRVTSAPTSLQ